MREIRVHSLSSTQKSKIIQLNPNFSVEVDKEEENQILQWVMPLHLDDKFKNLDL